jgi:hypothetical protein
MPRIRHIALRRFRGFEDLEVIVPAQAVLVGEPGAGRSDLIEALARIFDRDYGRTRRADELDFFGGRTDDPAEVVVTLSDLGDTASSPFLPFVEFWDSAIDALIPDTQDPSAVAAAEEVVRLGYWLAARPDGTFDERVFWAKSWVSGQQPTQWVTASQSRLVPFLWQRGIDTKPLDLGPRGDLRRLIEREPGEEFNRAVDRFLADVETAAGQFSSQDRLTAALNEIYTTLRGVRRFDADRPAADLIRFLPDGGARSGLLRSLAAAITLAEGPEFLPAGRHGITTLTALRAGILISAARSVPGAIVVIDDFGGDMDPFLARHVATELRTTNAQVIVATKGAHVVEAFEPDQVVRLYWRAGTRRVARGPDQAARTNRIALRFRASQLSPALSASAVIVVDGYHDRLGLTALAQRAQRLGLVESFPAAGITFVDADGTGNLAHLARAAKDFGLHTLVLADNDQAAGAAAQAGRVALAESADAVVSLPPRIALERLLLADIPDDELRRVAQSLATQLGDVAVPATLATAVGRDLQNAVIPMLKQPGQLHVAFVGALGDAYLCPAAIRVLAFLRRLAIERSTAGLIQLPGLAEADIAAVAPAATPPGS